MQGQLVEDCRTVAGTVLDGEDEPEYVCICQCVGGWVGGGWEGGVCVRARADRVF
jgi:hypothetical protein